MMTAKVRVARKRAALLHKLPRLPAVVHRIALGEDLAGLGVQKIERLPLRDARLGHQGEGGGIELLEAIQRLRLRLVTAPMPASTAARARPCRC